MGRIKFTELNSHLHRLLTFGLPAPSLPLQTREPSHLNFKQELQTRSGHSAKSDFLLTSLGPLLVELSVVPGNTTVLFLSFCSEAENQDLADFISSNRNSLYSNAIHNEDYFDRGADNNVGDVGTGTNVINVMVTLLKHYFFYYLMMRLRWIFCYKILNMKYEI